MALICKAHRVVIFAIAQLSCYYPRDAVCWLGISYDPVCVYVSVRQSITNRYCVKTAEPIQLVFGRDATVDLFHDVF